MFFLFIFIACKKNETTAPTVEIYAPVANDSFYIADSFRVYFNIKDKNLQNYKVIISNKLTGRIYVNEEMEANTTDFTFDKKMFINTISDTSVLLNVLGIDANGNTGGKGVAFKLKM